MDTVAKDIMSREMITTTEKATVEEVLKLLANNRVTGLPVVNNEGNLVGVVSEYDLIEMLSHHQKPHPELLKKNIQFSTSVKTIDENTPLSQIIDTFVETRCRRLPVLKEGQLVGIITRRDIMKIYFYRARLAEL